LANQVLEDVEKHNVNGFTKVEVKGVSYICSEALKSKNGDLKTVKDALKTILTVNKLVEKGVMTGKTDEFTRANARSVSVLCGRALEFKRRDSVKMEDVNEIQ
jgi:hypothetical protein